MPQDESKQSWAVNASQFPALSLGETGIEAKLWVPPTYHYEPQPDITAFELARLLPFFHALATGWDPRPIAHLWETLGSAQRHFAVKQHQ